MIDRQAYMELAITTACDGIKSAAQDMPSVAADELERATRWLRRAAEMLEAERAVKPVAVPDYVGAVPLAAE